MQKQQNILIKLKGTTLIEMLAAVAIFSILIGAISGLFISGIQSQERILSNQELLDQTSYILEYMGRTIRMARKELSCSDKDDPSTCNCLKTAGYGFNYENPGSDLGKIRFLDENNKCHQFELGVDYILYEKVSTDNNDSNFGSSVSLTSPELDIVSLNFNLSGQSQADSLQPRVTIFLKILGKETKIGRPEINIQTTTSQRSLDTQH